ncbi:hypothetical protein SAMN05880501_10647 [Ureibacillus xyleni]|uniref:Uncharacterized protein n=1 Tax=Ureibacillus xyleni TaxID=614648 RepID=A0A285SRE9_9BACL|nr:hypothetical protein [Ureibacillus xyleni]SOC10852.1 hypothetical protein SAMN05880501_10647 [Ureibacillus xyleni]
MYQNRQVALSLERQHNKKIRHYYRVLADINLELAKLHKNIEVKINKEAYKHITEFVNQYISYTTVWNIKFIYNLESPEVALMQIFHLEYIFRHEPEARFMKERRILQEQKERFDSLKPYTKEHVQLRKQRMVEYLNEKEKNPTR